MTESKARPISTASSTQLSISDRMTDGDEEDSSLRSTGVPLSATSQSQSRQSLRQSISNLMGMARTTTISTIAMESNTAAPGSGSKCSPTRLVIALLQTPHRGLHLKVIELNPPLLKLPDNLEDAEDFLKNHNQVIKNLQSKQSPVEELLRQADNLIATQKPRAEVYAAMADSLGQTWKDLNGILEERRIVIQLAFNAHQKISECVQKMDEIYGEYGKISYIGSSPTVTYLLEEIGAADEAILKLKKDRAEILKRVAHCLEACDLLLNKIAEYNYTVDSRDLVLLKDVEFATRQVQRWLERLHDRRIILEEKLKNKKEHLEEISDNAKYDREIREVATGVDECRKLLGDFNFGDSVPSAERRREHLTEIMKELKTLQDKSLNFVKRLEDGEALRAKFTQRAALKTRVFDVLSEINDLLTEGMELDLSVGDAVEFFKLADEAFQQLDVFSSKGDAQASERDAINVSVQKAISKGDPLLNGYGRDSPKVKGVLAVYEGLVLKKESLVEQLDHLAILDEYNHFLEAVNQTYQNLFNVKTSTLCQPVRIPIVLESVRAFKQSQEQTAEQIKSQLALNSLTTKLEKIYPDLSEEAKCSTEKKVNELKFLFNEIIDVLSQRIEISEAWIKLLELYGAHHGLQDRGKLRAGREQILQLNENMINPLLLQASQTDPDLQSGEMRQEINRILQELGVALDSSAVNERIAEICQKYKGKLDAHLLGSPVGEGPQYYPVLPRDTVWNALETKPSKVDCIRHLINQVVRPKLKNTLDNFFQPLVTSFRQEILDANPTPFQGKSQDETDLERYCSRLKESYVTVTSEIEAYLSEVLKICEKVENYLKQKEEVESFEQKSQRLEKFDEFRDSVSETIKNEIGPKFDHLSQTIRHEEPPREGESEMESLRLLMSHLGHDEEMDSYRDEMARKIRESLIYKDLEEIGSHMEDLIRKLEERPSYGNCSEDARKNLENFERFEKVVEKVRDKLNALLAASDLPEKDAKASGVRDLLQRLMEMTRRRKEMDVLSLDYFRLIDESIKHYDDVYGELESIRQEAEDPTIQIPKIEQLLEKLSDIRRKQNTQEQRLAEIERISRIIFHGISMPDTESKHYPLHSKNVQLTTDLHSAETQLSKLLQEIKARCLAEALPLPMRKVEITEVQEKPEVPTSSVEIHELTTTSFISTLRRSVSPSPSPLITSEKQTQFEPAEELEIPVKVERDTETQTLEEKIMSHETQTELLETVVEVHPRPVSRGANLNPTIEDALKDAIVKEGERVVLECRISGKIDKVVWFKDGFEVANNPDYKTQFSTADSTASLTIDEAVVEDSAVFTCRVSGGEDGTAVAETSGRLTVKEPHDTNMIPPKFEPHPPISLGIHGKPHVIQLTVQGHPLPTVQWFKNGQCIDTSPDYIITFNNGLCKVEFDELLKELDEGIFTCVATNKVGQAETHLELQIQGDVSKKGMKQKPRIIRPLPKTLVGRTGQPLKLQVEFESPTECNIIWWKDEIKVLNHANSSADIKTENNVATLSFTEVYPVDAGKYTVLVRNAVGECQSECVVTVKGIVPPETSDSEHNVSDVEALKPAVKMQLKDVKVKAGESVKLDCVIVGHPEPEVIWYKNSTPIKESANHHLIFHGDRCALIVKSASEADVGRYSVIAKNSGGEVGSSCEVVIQEEEVKPEVSEEDVTQTPMEKPSFAKIIQDEMVTAGDKFAFTVELSPESGESTKVEWYKNNEKIVAGNDIELLQNGNVHSLQFNACKLSDRGNYLAKASNPFGDTKCFACLIVKENLAEAELQQKAGGDIWEETEQAPKPVLPSAVKKSVSIAKAPRFIVPLDGKMVDEGDRNVVLRCVIEANPPATLKWTKNNDAASILPSPYLAEKYNEKSGEVELTLKQVSIQDAGRYTLTASNDLGVSSSVCDVVVKKTTFPPVFSKRLQSLTLEEGKRLYLEVDVFAKPLPQVIWYLNHLPIASATEFQLKSDTPTRHALIVPQVDATKHAGEYRITARNDAGEASSVCTISIIPGIKAPPVVPPKPKFAPSPEPISVRELQLQSPPPLPPLSQVTSSVTREISSLETRTTTTTMKLKSLSPTPTFENLRGLSLSPLPLPLSDILLEPGPEPEILVAPGPSDWKSTENRVQAKVKTFEVRAEAPDVVAPPQGGVRIIPIKDLPAPTPPPLPTVPPPSMIAIPPSAFLLEEPKVFSDSSYSVQKEEGKTEGGGTFSSEQRIQSSVSSSEMKFIRPSKFIPERLRESDYESDVDGRPFPIKWTPSSVSPLPPPVTTSAFAPCKPGTFSTTFSSSSEQKFHSTLSSTMVKPKVPPKPKAAVATAYTPPPQRESVTPTSFSPTPVGGPERIRSMIKSWPPQEYQEPSSLQHMTSSISSVGGQVETTGRSFLSPIPHEGGRGGRSPTPNREALEMDRLWSRPLRFSSPTKYAGTPSPMTSPPPMSPRFVQIPVTRAAFSPLTSPTPSYYRDSRPSSIPTPGPKSPRDTMYYVSVVSTPRTTPVPPAFSPEPEPISSRPKNFREMKDFFEQSSSFSKEETSYSSSSYHQESSSKSFFQSSFSDSRTPLLDASLLPPPGEAPEYCFAQPLTTSQKPGDKISTIKKGFGPGVTSTSQESYSSSSYSSFQQSQVTSSPYQSQPQPVHLDIPLVSEVRSVSPCKALVPYRKPSKFTPQLDFASSLDRRASEGDGPIRPKWDPYSKDARVTTWKRVPYEPPRRHSLILVDQRMMDLNQKFKNNIAQMTQGLCYNKEERHIAGQLQPGEADVSESIEAKPLIYFKYDFGYEFGIADPKSVIRAQSEPPQRGITGGDGEIPIPIIHEKSAKK